VAAEKPANTKRLLFLGSSVTFGWGVPAERAFPELVRQGLEKALPGIAFETINAGVPGYSSYQGILYLKKILSLYQPDVVVAEFGINDGTVAVKKADKDWKPGFWEPAHKALRNSGWGRLVLKVFGPVVKKPEMANKRQIGAEARENFYRVSMAGTQTRVAPDDFRANLDTMAELCKKNGALFYFLNPCLFNEYGNIEILPVVNLLTPETISIQKMLSDHNPQDLEALFLPFDEGHLSRKGHKKVAKGIVDFLKSEIASMLK
jgi:lysophospholipase L1-like esterase